MAETTIGRRVRVDDSTRAAIVAALVGTGRDAAPQIFVEAVRVAGEGPANRPGLVGAALRIPFHNAPSAGTSIRRFPLDLDADGKAIAVVLDDGSKLDLSQEQSAALAVPIAESLEGPTAYAGRDATYKASQERNAAEGPIVWLTTREAAAQHRLLQYALDHSIQPHNASDHRGLASITARALRDIGCTQTDVGWEIPEEHETAEVMFGCSRSSGASTRMLWAELVNVPTTAVDASTVDHAYRASIERERAQFGPTDPSSGLTL